MIARPIRVLKLKTWVNFVANGMEVAEAYDAETFATPKSFAFQNNEMNAFPEKAALRMEISFGMRSRRLQRSPFQLKRHPSPSDPMGQQ